MAGEGFLYQIGKLRAEVMVKRQTFRRAEDSLFEAEHKLQEAIIWYNQGLPREPTPAENHQPTKEPKK